MPSSYRGNDDLDHLMEKMLAGKTKIPTGHTNKFCCWGSTQLDPGQKPCANHLVFSRNALGIRVSGSSQIPGPGCAFNQFRQNTLYGHVTRGG